MNKEKFVETIENYVNILFFISFLCVYFNIH